VPRAVLALTLGGLSGLGVVHVFDAIMRSDVLPVRNLVIEGAGAERVPEIVAFAEVAHGTPLFSISLVDVKERVEEHPWVRRATVRRVAPDGLLVIVDERTARAVVATPALYLVDESGVPFKPAKHDDGVDLPVVTGLSPARLEGPDGKELLARAVLAIDAYDRAGAPAGRLDEIAVAASGALTLVVDTRRFIAIGSDGFDRKLARLPRVLRTLDDARVGSATHIWLDDERRPERVAVRVIPPAEVPTGSGT
jgi:cell division septal protein FtsQ